jgi:hypothetical protein
VSDALASLEETGLLGAEDVAAVTIPYYLRTREEILTVVGEVTSLVLEDIEEVVCTYDFTEPQDYVDFILSIHGPSIRSSIMRAPTGTDAKADAAMAFISSSIASRVREGTLGSVTVIYTFLAVTRK